MRKLLTTGCGRITQDRMRRVAIVGCGGSGKSTLARQLGTILRIDVYYLDALFWKPGWVRVSESEQLGILADILKLEKWIIDGDHPTTQALRFSRADTIIFLDMPTVICLWNTIRRTLEYWGRTRLGAANGCPERINWTLLKWIWLYPIVNRPNVVDNIERCSDGRHIIIMHRPAQVRKFVRELMQNGNFETSSPLNPGAG